VSQTRSKLINMIQQYLESDERPLYVGKKGLFGVKGIELITNRRILYVDIKKDKVGAKAYLDPDEEALEIAGVYTHDQYAHYQSEKEGLPSCNALIVTNKRLLLATANFKSPEIEIIDDILLSEISHIDILHGKVLASYVYMLELGLKTEKLPRFITISGWVGDIDSQEEPEKVPLEKFPRALSRAAGIEFAVPKIIEQTNERTIISLYIKNGLEFPKKCAQCGAQDRELQWVTIEMPRKTALKEALGANPMGELGIEEVKFHIPYCQDCIKGSRNAVAIGEFTGVRAILVFNNNIYAQDFVNVNRK
jgi:hypothetical protein